MADENKRQADLRKLVEHLKENPPPESTARTLKIEAEEAARAARAIDDAWQAVRKEVKAWGPSRSMVPPMMRGIGDSERARHEAERRIGHTVAKRREKKDREDLTRTRALESLARDAFYTRIAAISAFVAALAGVAMFVLMVRS